MTDWNAIRQRLYPPEFRIQTSGAQSSAVLVAAALSDIAARIETIARTPAPPSPAPSAAPAGPRFEKAFVVDLCNNFHRLVRSARSLLDADGTDASQLSTRFEQMRKVLHDHGIDYVDLTGQAYTPGRADFEPLGRPQATAGLTRDTIIVCDRPLISVDGQLIQPAKGIVGTPAGA